MQNGTSIETSVEREARIKRFLQMTDEEIKVNIADDPDAQVPNDPDFLSAGQWAKADGNIILPLVVDYKTAHWLQEHELGYQLFLSGVLKSYVESQPHDADRG